MGVHVGIHFVFFVELKETLKIYEKGVENYFQQE